MRFSRFLAAFGLAIAIVAISAGTYIVMHRRATDEPAQWVEGYSAEVSYTDMRDASKSYRGKVFSNVRSQPREFRIEMEFPNHVRIEIWRQDPSTFVVLDPETNTFWVPRIQAALKLLSPSGDNLANGVKRLVGRERVNGRLADHWEVTNIKGIVEEYWEDTRLHVTVKSVKPGVSTYELSNIREGRQKDELFVVPPGYQKSSGE